VSTTEQPQLVGRSSVTFLTGPLVGQTVPITKSVTTIGSDPTNDIVVAGDAQVAPVHARLRWKVGTWNIDNLSQNKALSVDSYAVEKVAIIQDESVIALGPETSFVFHTTQEQPVFLADDMPTLKTDSHDLQPDTASPLLVAPPAADSSSAPAEPTQLLTLDLADVDYAALANNARIAPSTEASAPLSSTSQRVGAEQQKGDQESAPRVSRTLAVADLMQGIPSLEVTTNSGTARKSYPLNKLVLTIGRDPASDIVIPDQTVSGQHLQITREGDHYVLVHPHPKREKTTNGLLYQGKKISGSEPFRKELAPGDVFRIGDEEGTLVTLTYHDGNAAPEEALSPIKPIKLDAAELTIGRHADNTVVLPHPQISGHHAKLVREGGAYRVLDLNSTNHIYVNAQPTTSQLLKLGDEIRIGPYRFVYQTTELVQYDESLTIRLDALKLKKVTKKQTTLLNDISLSIPPRSFVALVGASGAGKSTLLDALSGLRPVEGGHVLYNGQDYYRNLVAFNTQIGYVSQDDIVHGELTVERALFYAAKLRLPNDFTPAQIEQRITEVLEDVELIDRRRQPVKVLSGGQRKRVSLALELLANPSIFFLDEPTSGLDPGLDRKMMVLLRKLADKGHTIILVTHATNNVNVCDHVCFLARGGRLAYFGPPEDAKTYFGKTDFAEILYGTGSHQRSP
jgi:ABC-type multidrug transport system ATPase subunit